MAWSCSYCGQTGRPSERKQETSFDQKSVALMRVLDCPNPDCAKPTFEAFVCKRELVDGPAASKHWATGAPIASWRLLPASRARVWPNYIPAAVVQDYTEACVTENLSPKASAALSRRCLQSLIRDYFKISRGRLIDEINDLEDKVEADLLEALHAIRAVGNIAAHPERDPAIVVDVESGEASAMIDLLELLIEETYVARHERDEKIARARAIAANKLPNAAP